MLTLVMQRVNYYFQLCLSILVLEEVLDRNGFDGKGLIRGTQNQAVKDQLRHNTEKAIEDGVIGVPTYEVDSYIVWGQDRIDTVEDLLLGWVPGAPVQSTL